MQSEISVRASMIALEPDCRYGDKRRDRQAGWDTMVDFAVQRKNMVDSQVRPSDVTDGRLIRAMSDLPRERFLPSALAPVAYRDESIMLDADRGLAAPRVVAKILNAARINAGDSALVIGALTGYTAALVSRLAASVVAVDDDERRCAEARGNLAETACTNVAVKHGALPDGYPSEAPYAVIIVDGNVASIPSSLLDQLEDGGRLLAVMSDRAPARAAVWRRSGSVFGRSDVFEASAPVLPQFETAKEFVF